MARMERMTSSAALDGLTAEYWETYLEANPINATAIGDPRFDDRLADHTPAGTAATIARFEALLARADALDPARETAADRTTLSALRGSLAADIAELRTGLLEWNISPLEGAPVDFLTIPDYQRLETPEDGERMVARWQAMGRSTDQQLDTLRASLAEGRVASVSPVRRTITVLEEVLDAPIERWPLLDPLTGLEELEGWSAEERTRFATGLRGAVEDTIRPALIRLHDALVLEILPASRPDGEPGMCAVAGGDEGYHHLIRMHTSLDVDAAQLHRTGHEEIDRIDRELVELAGRTLGVSSLGLALSALRADPSLFFATRREVFEKATASLRRAGEVAPQWFGRLPLASCVILEMPAHEEEHVGAAYYRPSAEDGSRPGQLVLNTSNPHDRPRYEAEALAYHEAVPGHHLQGALSQELRGLPDFRRHLGPTAYFEGWGLYAERLADEMGLYSGDLDRLGMLSFDAWRAARLVVDTGIHAMGWSRQQAIDYMLAHTALSSRTVADEVDRYIALPGQALAYKTGQLELLRIREEAQHRMGAAFDIRGFHDAILSDGALPLPTLAEVVYAWADDAVARTGPYAIDERIAAAS